VVVDSRGIVHVHGLLLLLYLIESKDYNHLLVIN